MKMNKMKTGAPKSRAFRYGSVSVMMSVLLIVAIVFVNIVFTMLADKYLWYLDMTQNKLFTVSDACLELLSDVDEEVTIYFCDEKDNLEADSVQRYVLHTAMELANEFPNIKIEYVDIYTNPSAVERFKRSDDEAITTTSVIFESGTEWVTCTLRSFFQFDSSASTTPWGYKGEQRFAASILAITRAESPIACITTNHGETFYDTTFIDLLVETGYKVQSIDLTKDEIPEDCRLMVIYAPKDDFLVKDEGISDISEIEKLDKFLGGHNAMMVFMSPDNPVLPNLEEYLEEWGISFPRVTDELSGVKVPVKIKDDGHALTQDGMTFIGEYETMGLGAAIHREMRVNGTSPKVIFKNVMPINYSDVYSLTTRIPDPTAGEVADNASEMFEYGIYSSSANTTREIYDVFSSYSSAVATAGGEKIGNATAANPYRLMTVTREQRMIDDRHIDTSYVWACGSAEFATSKFLESNTYGNRDLLLYSLHTMGKETVPVDLEVKPFDNTTIEILTTVEADTYTWTLIIVPAVIVFAVGTVVILKRKHS